MIQNFFGFQSTSPEERTRRVKEVFTSVASKYDIMNDLMSLGIHRYWKSSFISNLPIKLHDRILDVAGGTGDIAFKILESYPHLNPAVTVCDLTPSMVHVGRERALDRGLIHNLDWTCGNAEQLPFPDNSYDIYTISFGMRNVTHLTQALTEAYRILKPGGRFVCLEFSKVQLPLLEKIYDRYSFEVLPWLGDLVAKDRASYQYLVESIRRFPEQEQFATLLKSSGFVDVHWKNFLGGVSCIHSAFKK
ncbi:bifunctional demethylmenaquinone methyltransferase/2-methoxy-6-polyprenyl-1,4-benzoquinol methylase UbiE [Candidatus Odyssella acanthamoebae]|uniref:Ubiquinone/menaquinone biosynthesis C-methyltransferase UbiE n=1 Tax=Candidatus Odyssella acanthamoebae TaxID=91604 RepID=A0A077AX08_9PROT|nr:bifunctional demethylmenaquinone methyltransferase/2-methoxy-6-polyprenyl-1,4-benzoquinol methylase UbiE [Candidatus Paracaedibacter acanthamoebae]AIK96158.1 ubiquinone biosynthesis methyltransferase UbiE [Candidatus Paracaedibacter acanthamoebae]